MSCQQVSQLYYSAILFSFHHLPVDIILPRQERLSTQATHQGRFSVFEQFWV